MLTVISPAKSLDFETESPISKTSKVNFEKETWQLVQELKNLSVEELSKLMGLSDTLSKLNFDRYQQFSPKYSKKNAKQAIYAFQGDVYKGMEAESFNEDEMSYAQEHLRILSGLYGALKPLDLMQPYRLEMGTKFENSKGRNLYEFWGNQITEHLNNQLKKSKSKYLLNLASNEYFKSVKKKNIEAEIITPNFKDEKNGQFKVISFFAKKARGAMTAYVVKNRIQTPEDLQNFNWEGYLYNPELSKPKEPVFTR